MNDQESSGGELILPRRDYPLLASDDEMAKVLRLIHNNLGVGRGPVPTLDVFKLSRIKNPVSGDTVFRVETATSDERHNSLTGIIVAFRQARVYYKRAFGSGQGTQPPDCSSRDGFTGEGDPGGDCTRCPLAAFGTALQGGGQACREKRELLVLMPGQRLPHLLSITPTSLTNFTKYSLNLISAGVNYWEATTKMTLEPSVTTSGMPIARIRFTLYAALPTEQAERLTLYHESMLAMLAPMTVDATVYEAEEASEKGRTGTPQAAPAPDPSDNIPF